MFITCLLMEPIRPLTGLRGTRSFCSSYLSPSLSVSPPLASSPRPSSPNSHFPTATRSIPSSTCPPTPVLAAHRWSADRPASILALVSLFPKWNPRIVSPPVSAIYIYCLLLTDKINPAVERRTLTGCGTSICSSYSSHSSLFRLDVHPSFHHNLSFPVISR